MHSRFIWRRNRKEGLEEVVEVMKLSGLSKSLRIDSLNEILKLKLRVL